MTVTTITTTITTTATTTTTSKYVLFQIRGAQVKRVVSNTRLVYIEMD